MTHDELIMKDEKWCNSHPIVNVNTIDIDVIKRRSINEIVIFLFENVDIYNCQFRNISGTNISSINHSTLQIVEKNIESIIKEFFSDDDELDLERLIWDWTPIQQQKFLLYVSHSSLFKDANNLERKEIEEITFYWIDTINLLHRPCTFSDTEAESFFVQTKMDQLISKIHEFVELLGPERKVYGCEMKWIDWTDDQHRRYLLFLCNEMLHRLTNKEVTWNSFEEQGNINDKFRILRLLFPYYAGQKTELYLQVLRNISNKYTMYQRTILSMVFVLGFLAPFEQREFFRHVAKEGLIPGSCEKDKDELLEILAHFVLAWFYNDTLSHEFLDDSDIGDIEMPRWDMIPPELEGNLGAQEKGLVSMYSYYAPIKGSPDYSYGSLFCTGRDGFHKVLCHPEKFPPEDPEQPPEIDLIDIPSGALTGAPEAMLHSLGQMSHGLALTEGELEPLLLQDFREYVRIAPITASYLIDVAKNTDKSRGADLMRGFEKIVINEDIPEDQKNKLLKRIIFEIDEFEHPSKSFEGINGKKISLYEDESKNEETATKSMTDLLANMSQYFEKASEGIREIPPEETNMSFICDEYLTKILQIGTCSDKFLDFTAFDQGTSADKAFWNEYGFSLFLGDLEVAKPLSERQRKALEYLATEDKISSPEFNEKFGGISNEEAHMELNDLKDRGILEVKSTLDHVEYSLKKQYKKIDDS